MNALGRGQGGFNDLNHGAATLNALAIGLGGTLGSAFAGMQSNSQGGGGGGFLKSFNPSSNNFNTGSSSMNGGGGIASGPNFMMISGHSVSSSIGDARSQYSMS